MTDLPTWARDENVSKAVLAQEARLRVLHQLRPEARLVAGFEAPYTHFVRDLRERLHPRGVHDVREIRIEDGRGALTVAVDVGDRLGCDVYYGYYDEAFEARQFAACLPPDATALDVGANFGYYTLLAAQAAPAGVVHAFEPDPAAMALLRRNVAANDLTGRVHTWPLAVGDADGEVEFHLAEESAFSGVLATGRARLRGTLRVRMCSLDSFAREHGIQAVDALKIDVEGLEGSIVRGATELLRASPDPLVLLEASPKNHAEQAEADLGDALAELFADGYQGLVLDLDADGGLRTLASAGEFALLTSSNAFMVRAGGQMERRLRELVRAEIGGASASIGALPAGRPDERPLMLYAGIEPAVVAAALRERLGLLEQSREENTQLRQLAERLSAQRSEMRDQVLALGARLQSQAEEWRALSERHTQEIEDLRAHTEHLVDQVGAQSADVQHVQRDLEAARENQDRLHRRIIEQDATIQLLESQLIAARADRDHLQARCDEQAREIERLRARPFGEGIGVER